MHSTYAQFHALLDTLHFLAVEDYALVLRLMRREINESLAYHETLHRRVRAQFTAEDGTLVAPKAQTRWRLRLAFWLLRRDDRKRRRP